MHIDANDLKLSALRGLLGNVSENLRAVNIGVKDNVLKMDLFYDGTISEEVHELGAHVIDQIIADFWRNDLEGLEFDENIIQWDFPKPLPKEGHCIYLRCENDSTASST